MIATPNTPQMHRHNFVGCARTLTMRDYEPLCSYVSEKTGVSIYRAMAFNLAAGAVLGYGAYFAMTGEYLGGAVLLPLAVAAETKAEKFMPKALRSCNVGVNAGGIVLRFGQVASFLAPYILAGSLHIALLQNEPQFRAAKDITIDIT